MRSRGLQEPDVLHARTALVKVILSGYNYHRPHYDGGRRAHARAPQARVDARGDAHDPRSSKHWPAHARLRQQPHCHSLHSQSCLKARRPSLHAKGTRIPTTFNGPSSELDSGPHYTLALASGCPRRHRRGRREEVRASLSNHGEGGTYRQGARG